MTQRATSATSPPTSQTRATESPAVIGLLPFAGVILFAIAEIVALVAGGGSEFLRWSTMNAVLFLIGSSSVGNGIAHLFFGPVIARSIGWKSSPFQFEVGAANLGIGISAIVMAAAFPPETWLGPIIVALVFLFLAGFGHIREIIEKRNLSIDNAGPILILDFLMPAVTLFLWIWLALS